MTTGDIVIFTGRTETFYDYEEPTNLVIGKAYEIESIRVYNWRTDFKLKGEKGTFSSTWFTEAPARRRFKFMVMRDGRAHFIVSGNVVFDTFDDKLGTISDLFNFAMNNRLIIDFQNMVVRKAWWPSFLVAFLS